MGGSKAQKLLAQVLSSFAAAAACCWLLLLLLSKQPGLSLNTGSVCPRNALSHDGLLL